ncbi:MAG: TM2 domain-containing protein, partial [Elusimicrobiaceae bacterium]|nr:TM2 domain-containing protein [Elusimicrobiaceae bacterium]
MQNYSNPKSATAAGLLGIFLGSFGAHCWYLGDKKKGIIHISLFAGGVALEILASALVASSVGSALMTGSVGLLALSPILGGIGGLVLAGNSLWGLIE